MALRLAQASSSEYFTAYGTPPNTRRTGVTKNNPAGNRDGELNIVPFYGGWEMVFRPKKEKAAERIAWLAEGAVENGSHIGYGQASLKSDGGKYPREGVFDALYMMTEPDTRKIGILCNCDCSSLAGACVYSAGHEDPALYEPKLRTMWTGTEESILMGTGAFVKLTDPLLLELGTGLRRGDILLKAGHTAIAIDSDDHADTYPVRLEGCAYSRIRSAPSLSAATLSILPGGTILNAEGSTEGDGVKWYRVLYAGQTGYTSAAYAKPLPTGSCTGNTWLRKTAGTSGEPVIVIPAGATVYLTGKTCRASSGAVKRTWYEVFYGGHQGWASGLYIRA